MADMLIKGKLDTRNYERGIRKMQGKNREFGGGLSRIKGMIAKAFAVAAILGAVRAIGRAAMAAVDFGSKLSDMAAQTGVAVETFQKLQRAVRDAGGENQHLVNTLTRIKDAQGEAITGDKIMTEAIERLGVSADDFIQMSVEDAFVAISKGLTDAGNSADAFSAAADIIGQRNVPKMLEAMNAAAGGIQGLGKDLSILAERDAVKLDLIADKMANLKNNIKTGFAGFVSTLFFGGIDEQVDSAIERANEIKAIEEEVRRKAAQDLKARREEERLKKLQEIAAKEDEIRAKQAEEIGKIERSVKLDITTDSMRRMGGFAGSMESDQLKYARQQAEITRKLADYQKSLPAIERNTREGGGLA